jgi:hypothetical protein
LFKKLWDKVEKEPVPRQRWYLFAAWHKHELDLKTATEKDRLKEKVGMRLKDVHEQLDKKKIPKYAAKAVCLDVLALYSQDKEMASVVEEAKKLLEEISK